MKIRLNTATDKVEVHFGGRRGLVGSSLDAPLDKARGFAFGEEFKTPEAGPRGRVEIDVEGYIRLIEIDGMSRIVEELLGRKI